MKRQPNIISAPPLPSANNNAVDSVVITVETDGTLQFLNTPHLRPLLDEGTSQVRRASHVEPMARLPRLFFHLLRRVFGEQGRVAQWTREWPVVWQVNLAPSAGPILKDFVDRDAAIAAEICWLNINVL